MRLSFNKKRFKKVSLISVSVFSIVVITGCIFYQTGFRINLTSSLPLGIWKIDKSFARIEKGDYVWFTPTKKIADFALKRGYLEKNTNCENNAIPLLKIVYGLPGDKYSFHQNAIRINNVPVKNLKRRETDSKDRPMPKISNGIIRENQLFVLTMHSHSYDSRYYGTIPIENVIGTAKPILTWMN
ncbi:MAG: conjugative transfer signal peptidase TraF [Proteobacteria bacterium]|nr:conjugative transfer signal peptidase TraF [Pseudomonadota bacterium]MBU1586270.1 conjugative transfer signal peptidase TraF [Pseudomonadota bacterium]MBU2453166.1 conjugative transfer signal peptidase TraF [Pseudomonadota bacterium]MBU2630803.1 conjugative transfer signal peptidase TraF [Pseudomonadota bacterium]